MCDDCLFVGFDCHGRQVAEWRRNQVPLKCYSRLVVAHSPIFFIGVRNAKIRKIILEVLRKNDNLVICCVEQMDGQKKLRCVCGSQKGSLRAYGQSVWASLAIR